MNARSKHQTALLLRGCQFRFSTGLQYNSLFKAGEPHIATLKDLEVIDNPFWGVKSGKTVDLTLI
eukprot:scaffold18654_cov51-Attheya_sp.AAC.4